MSGSARVRFLGLVQRLSDALDSLGEDASRQVEDAAQGSGAVRVNAANPDRGGVGGTRESRRDHCVRGDGPANTAVRSDDSERSDAAGHAIRPDTIVGEVRGAVLKRVAPGPANPACVADWVTWAFRLCPGRVWGATRWEWRTGLAGLGLR